MANYGIALQARSPQFMSYNDLVATRDQMLARQNALAMQQQTMQQNALAQQKQRATEAAMAGAASLAGAGDFAGAEQKYGLGAGNIDVHTAISKLQDEQRAVLKTRMASAAPVAIQALQSSDPAERMAIIKSAAPMLVQNGWKPEEIAQFQPTDQALNGIINNARSIDDAIKLYDKQNEAYTLTPGSSRFVGGKQIASVAPLPKETYKVDENGNIVAVSGTTATPVTMGGAGNRTMGWTPVGGENAPAAVRNKSSMIANKAGVSPDAPLSRDQFLGLDMTQNEGRAAGRNNPGNMKNTDGSFKNFNSIGDYNAAQSAWLQRRWNEGARTVNDAVMGRVVGGAGSGEGQTLRAPASAQQLKNQEKEAAARKVGATIGAKIDHSVANIDQLLNSPGLSEITGHIRGNMNDTMLGLSSQKAANSLAILKTIAANAILTELQELKASSPTGGALGQVSDAENEMLKSAAAKLDRAQDTETFKAALQEYRARLVAAKQRLLSGYAEDFGHGYDEYNAGGSSVAAPRASSRAKGGATVSNW